MGVNYNNIRLRSDGRLEGRISINGKTKSFYGKTKAEIKRKMNEYEREYSHDQSNPKTDYLGVFIENWLRQHKRFELKESSYDRLETLYISHIKNSSIATKCLGDISYIEIQKLLNEMVCPSDNKRAYAKSTAKKTYELLTEVYKFADAQYKMTYNPMLNVHVPKESGCVKKSKETFSLTPLQIELFKQQCTIKTSSGLYKYKYGLVFMLMLNLGVRVGEMIALQFTDFDLKNKIVRINKNAMPNVKIRNEQGDPVNVRSTKITTPKTRRSIRTLPLNDKALYYLQEIIADNEARKISTEYVCSTTIGTMATARNLQRTLDIIASNAGLPHIWLHILRHTFGSELIRNKVDVSVVSKLMGHTNTSITYNVYVHVIEEEAAKAMTLVNIG